MTRRDVIHSPGHQALKRDTKSLIRAAGGLEGAEENSRVKKSALSDYQSINSDAFMPVDVVADLEAITRGTADWPVVTRRLASMAGCSLYALPEPDRLNGNWLGQVGALAGQIGKLSERLGQAAADGTVSADQVRKSDLIDACDDAIVLLVNLRARFERIVEEGRS